MNVIVGGSANGNRDKIGLRPKSDAARQNSSYSLNLGRGNGIYAKWSGIVGCHQAKSSKKEKEKGWLEDKKEKIL